MHIKYLQSHQTILYFFDEMNFALLFQYCRLATDLSQYPHLVKACQILQPELLAKK